MRCEALKAVEVVLLALSTCVAVPGARLVGAAEEATTEPGHIPASAPPMRSALPPGVFLRIDGHDVPKQRFLNELGDSIGESYRETFIAHIVLEQEAAAKGVSVSNDEVEEAVRKNLNQVVKDRFSGEENRFEEALKSRGMTLESWKRRAHVDARYDALANKLIRQQRTISADDVKSLFEERYGKGGVQIMVRNIKKNVLVSASPAFTPQQFAEEKEKIDIEARGRAEEALKKLRSGESFESVLTAYSDDPRKGQGGTIIGPWKGRFGPAFDEAVSQLKKDEISPVVKCNDGYRIAQVSAITAEEEVHPLQILVAAGVDNEIDGGRSEEEGRKKAADLLAQVRAGADFAKLAKENSDDPDSSEKGGDLGFFGRHAMAQPVEDTAFALEPGEVSDLVKTNFGYHIIKLVEKRQTENRTLRQVLISMQFARVKDRRLRPGLEAKAQTELEEIAAKLESGNSFADLAKSSSDDGVTRTEGGLITGYREGVYGGAFDAAVKEMKAGDKPRIVKDGAGNLHLVKLDAVVTTDYGAVEADLRKELMQRDASSHEKGDYLKKLRDAATVVP